MIPDFKTCSNCKENKHNSEFHTRKVNDYIYLKTYCKECSNKRNKKYQSSVCECGNDKLKISKYCTDCSVQNKRKYHTLKDVKIYAEKYGQSAAYNIIRLRAQYIKKIYTQRQNCTYSKHTEVCHIKPIGFFNDDDSIELINDTSNLLVLCPNCHWEFDNGLLEL